MDNPSFSYTIQDSFGQTSIGQENLNLDPVANNNLLTQTDSGIHVGDALNIGFSGNVLSNDISFSDLISEKDTKSVLPISETGLPVLDINGNPLQGG